jgi:hypothetical protein
MYCNLQRTVLYGINIDVYYKRGVNTLLWTQASNGTEVTEDTERPEEAGQIYVYGSTLGTTDISEAGLFALYVEVRGHESGEYSSGGGGGVGL